MNPPRVRPATPDDVDELVRLRHEMFRDMAASGAYRRGDDIEDTSWYASARDYVLTGLETGVLIAYVADAHVAADDVEPAPAGAPRLTGCAVVSFETRMPGPGTPLGLVGWVSTVYVAPQSRGQGLARELVQACLDWSEEHGVETVHLHATADAEGLYRSLGFGEIRSTALRRHAPPRP
ncbi:GNAT family N-acetyltransferase [Cellulomonas carbonis]|uniref:GNAT family N-acetyltransferase n=1 Tax=Cellulomonas carbonis TaxID=1386092 RepID=UPI000693B5D1|nr:GNAT family N-acetyltransferase [Cellulomonas carbonis]